MKHLTFAFFLMIVSGMLFSSCERSNTPVDNPTDENANELTKDAIIIGTGDEPGEYLQESAIGAPACITVVRFAEQDKLNKVIVQHPLKNYDGINGRCEYNESGDLSLNIQPGNYMVGDGLSVSQPLAKWADEQMNIAGTSPYIPLSDGYYMIDWKWHQLFPVSALALLRPNALYDNFSEMIHNHIFMTDIDWKDLEDVSLEYDSSLSTEPVKGIEIIRVWTLELDGMFNAVDSDPYLCWNMSIYVNNGMCLDNAYMYYQYGDCTSDGRTHSTYINYCDSLQNIYRQRLIEVIKNNQLKKLGF